MARFVSRDSQPLRLIKHVTGRLVEEIVEPLVVFLDQKWRKPESVEQGVFDELGKAEHQQRAQIEKDPFRHQLGSVEPKWGISRVGPVQRSGQEVKRRLIVGFDEVGFALVGELAFQSFEKLRVAGVELG